MAYISPRSDVYILRGISLDSGYEHTVLQTSKESQFNMFNKSQYVKYRLDNQSYQRAGRNRIRVAILADNLYDCNYMMFRNTAFGDKWFYAFINSVNYINDNASEISYTIDDMQTWYFDYDLGQCYVEREHTLTDEIGENLVPERLETGELIPQNKWDFTYPDSVARNGYQYMFVVWYVPNEQIITGNRTDSDGNIVWINDMKDPDTDNGIIANGIYMGATFITYPMVVETDSDVQKTQIAINRLITKLIDISANIINIAQVPFNLWTDWELNIRKPATRSFAKYMTKQNWDSNHTHYFVPRNNKLFTYPYKRLVVSNNAGDYAVYMWERFYNPSRFDFRIQGVPVITPEMLCYPHNYRGITDDYESGLVLSDFPSPPWSEDTFAKWWAQNKESVVMSMVSTAIMAIATAAAIMGTGGAAGVAAGVAASAPVASAFGTGVAGSFVEGATSLPTLAAAGAVTNSAKKSIINQVGGIISQQNAPDQLRGQLSITSLRTAQNRVGYTFYDMGLEYSTARSIDNYFTMFGYAIRQVKYPNVRVAPNRIRPHWNYIETKGCIIHPANGTGLPADAESHIASIYDKGITFWKDLNEVGNYNLDNSPQ